MPRTNWKRLVPTLVSTAFTSKGYEAYDHVSFSKSQSEDYLFVASIRHHFGGGGGGGPHIYLESHIGVAHRQLEALARKVGFCGSSPTDHPGWSIQTVFSTSMAYKEPLGEVKTAVDELASEVDTTGIASVSKFSALTLPMLEQFLLESNQPYRWLKIPLIRVCTGDLGGARAVLTEMKANPGQFGAHIKSIENLALSLEPFLQSNSS